MGMYDPQNVMKCHGFTDPGLVPHFILGLAIRKRRALGHIDWHHSVQGGSSDSDAAYKLHEYHEYSIDRQIDRYVDG